VPAALKPKPANTITPIVPEEPWYQNTMTLAIAGGALLIVGLLALMRFMRRPKPVVLDETDGDVLVEEPHHYAELPTESEAELLDALAQHPGDPDLSLKLLRLYYAERDASKFEAAAEALYAHIADPTQPEWQEVKAMGEDLVPHNPLFNRDDSLAGYMHESVAPVSHAEDAHLSDDNFDLGNFDADGTPAASEENFDFDLADHSAKTTISPVVEHVTPVAAPATLVHAAKPAEDFFAGEDTIGTKLDLARAYLDMGDPEGARSMLDEVMSEGNDSQKGEARKLLAEIK
jgi:pilus assembly protein FimV